MLNLSLAFCTYGVQCGQVSWWCRLGHAGVADLLGTCEHTYAVSWVCLHELACLSFLAAWSGVAGDEDGYVVAMTDGEPSPPYVLQPGTRVRLVSDYSASERRLGACKPCFLVFLELFSEKYLLTKVLLPAWGPVFVLRVHCREGMFHRVFPGEVGTAMTSLLQACFAVLGAIYLWQFWKLRQACLHTPSKEPLRSGCWCMCAGVMGLMSVWVAGISSGCTGQFGYPMSNMAPHPNASSVHAGALEARLLFLRLSRESLHVFIFMLMRVEVGGCFKDHHAMVVAAVTTEISSCISDVR